MAGWGAQRSLDAQNAKGLRANESSIHDEDYGGLEDYYRDAYNRWEDGPTTYRKATVAALKRAEEEKLKHRVQIVSRIPPVPIPAPRPFYDKRDSAES